MLFPVGILNVANHNLTEFYTMHKILWIDVGTHFAQEHSSIFGSNLRFYRYLLRRFIGSRILGRGKFVKLSILRDILAARKEVRASADRFFSIFIEANPKIALTEDIYRQADMVFNIALTDDRGANGTITKLYLGDDGEQSQSSSVFLEKNNVTEEEFVVTLGVSANFFFEDLAQYLFDRFGEYTVLLRLNCEGAEDDVIYSASEAFGAKLKLICGSLKDVGGVKGAESLQNLETFIQKNGLAFEDFHSGISTWSKAHQAILNLLNESPKP